MDDATKAKLQAASSEADTITDGILLRVSQSKWSWLIIAISHVVAFAIGAFLFHK